MTAHSSGFVKIPQSRVTLNTYIWPLTLLAWYPNKEWPVYTFSSFKGSCDHASFFPYASKMHIYIRYLNYRCLSKDIAWKQQKVEVQIHTKGLSYRISHIDPFWRINARLTGLHRKQVCNLDRMGKKSLWSIYDGVYTIYQAMT